MSHKETPSAEKIEKICKWVEQCFSDETTQFTLVRHIRTLEKEKKDLIEKCECLIGYLNVRVEEEIASGIKEEWNDYLSSIERVSPPWQ